jgi:hypothetical protein
LRSIAVRFLSADRPSPAQCARAHSRGCAIVLAAGAAGLLGTGCGRRSPNPPPLPPPDAGASREAVIREPVSLVRADAEARYKGTSWALSLDDGSGWQRQTGDRGSTLRLTRDSDGVQLDLVLSVYPIRPGMPVRTFLAAYAMWMAEEGGPRIEHEHDEAARHWRGYAIHDDRETYYAFLVSDERAYVIQESASSGVLSKEEVEQFYRIVEAFECYPRTADETTVPDGNVPPSEDQ